MVITKDEMQHILDTMPDKIDVEEVFDKILISAKLSRHWKIRKKDSGKIGKSLKQNG